jgi:hypothetical protein
LVWEAAVLETFAYIYYRYELHSKITTEASHHQRLDFSKIRYKLVLYPALAAVIKNNTAFGITGRSRKVRKLKEKTRELEATIGKV